jgi:hypothetical protein
MNKPAAMLRRIFCCKSRAKFMRPVVVAVVLCSPFGKRVAKIVSAERLIVVVHVCGEDVGSVQIS